jgi:peptidoglycan/xylan/chitin deacetylase (PgdA/CDA1 family)
MRVFSPLLKHVIYPGLSRAGYLSWRNDAAPTVLTYHGVLPEGYSRRSIALDGHLITAEAFRSQLRLLKSKFNVISPEEFRLWCRSQLKLPSCSVLLTCDDALLNALTDMRPIIREFGVPFLFFVTGASTAEQRSMLWYERLYLLLTQRKGRASLQMPWHDAKYVAQTNRQKELLWQELIRRLSALEDTRREHALEEVRIQIGISENWRSEYSQNESLRRRFLMLNRAEVQNLADAGMTIGAHTLSHPMLSQMEPEAAFFEIAESRRRLENAVGREVWALAYPFGTPDSAALREADLAQRAGFQAAFMNTEIETANSPFRLPRIHVSHGMNCAQLEARLCGVHRVIRETFSQIASG